MCLYFQIVQKLWVCELQYSQIVLKCNWYSQTSVCLYMLVLYQRYSKSQYCRGTTSLPLNFSESSVFLSPTCKYVLNLQCNCLPIGLRYLATHYFANAILSLHLHNFNFYYYYHFQCYYYFYYHFYHMYNVFFNLINTNIYILNYTPY